MDLPTPRERVREREAEIKAPTVSRLALHKLASPAQLRHRAMGHAPHFVDSLNRWPYRITPIFAMLIVVRL